MKRCSTICSSLTSPAKTRSCCNLKDDYDVSDAILSASVLFFRLTGRQAKYAGTCTKIVRPCAEKKCCCDRGLIHGMCSGCTCRMDSFHLPNVCRVLQVVVDGKIVDPSLYKLDGEHLVRVDCRWPTCQNLNNNAAALAVKTLKSSDTNVGSLTVTAQLDGTFRIVGPLTLVNDLMVITDESGEVWNLPMLGLTESAGVWTFNPATVYDANLDWATAYTTELVRKWTDTTYFGDAIVAENYSYDSFTVADRPIYNSHDDPTGTFQVTYQTGCGVSSEVQDAVAVLACELAKARCGDSECRLPSNLRSFTLDGDRISAIDPYVAFNDGLTGLPEVDRIIKSINPKGLRREGRMLSGYNTRKLHRS